MKIKDKSFFCSAPFLQVSSKTSGEWLPCCTSKKLGYSIHDTSLFKFYRSDEMRRMRKEFASGDISDWLKNICQNCIRRERQNGMSKRIKDLSLMSKELRAHLKSLVEEARQGKDPMPKKMSSIKLKLFGNFCNLKCLMCSPECSSSYAKEVNNHPDHPLYDEGFKYSIPSAFNPIQQINPKIRERLIKDLSFFLPKCEKLEITGGEPTLNSYVWGLLEELKDSVPLKNLELSLGTNATWDFSKKLLPLSKHFRKVTLYISIDAIDKKADFIRFGCRFKKIQKHVSILNELKKNSNIQPIVSVTLQALNIGSVGEIYNWSKKMKIPIVYYNIVVNPRFLMIQHLPNSIKESYRERIESHAFLSQSKWKESFYQSLKPKPDTGGFPKLIRFLERMDAIRKTHYASLWPEFKRI